MSRHPYLDAPPLAFAHRGGAAEGDENTVEAFARAVAAGYRYIETDVQATADGVPVVVHDETLLRVAGAAAAVAELSWADLATVRVGGAGAVPRLDDVLHGWPRIRFNLDVKSDAATGPVVDAVRRGAADLRVLLASFSDARLRRLRRLAGPQVATSLGARAVRRLWLASRSGVPVWLPSSAVAVQVPPRHNAVTVVDARFLRHAHRRGLQVHVWTIDDPAEMAGLLDAGVDGIMTDHIHVLRDVIVARGQWPSGPIGPT